MSDQLTNGNTSDNYISRLKAAGQALYDWQKRWTAYDEDDLRACIGDNNGDCPECQEQLDALAAWRSVVGERVGQ